MKANRWILLLAILGALMALKLSFSPGVWWGRDGIYFLQVARHVSEGEGLASNTSLYHQGFRSFPHRVNQSPIWPVVLGYSGRWFGLEPSGGDSEALSLRRIFGRYWRSEGWIVVSCVLFYLAIAAW